MNSHGSKYMHLCVFVCIYLSTNIYAYERVHVCVRMFECVYVCVCERERIGA